MKKTYVLYNKLAGAHRDGADEQLKALVAGGGECVEISAITDYADFFAGLDADDCIVISGGDGTLNRFVNDTEGLAFSGTILYIPNGTGNDFAHELGKPKGCEPFDVTRYLKDLPTVEVKGKTCRFLNGIGYGIDGYCCEVGDALREKSDKPVDYTMIAIKGLLFYYKPTNATVTVDGVAHTYKKVWLAPTMKGKCYGGGMFPTPAQDRNDPEGKLSVMVWHGSGKLRTLMAFPSIFKGEHIKHKNCIDIFTGHDITVEFDRPVALQIDGETVLGVTAYTARSHAKVGQTANQ